MREILSLTFVPNVVQYRAWRRPLDRRPDLSLCRG